MKLFSDRGAVSPMMCIVVSAFVFINFAFQDYITVTHQMKIAKRINDLACSSVMASFDETLEGYYGLYCLDVSKRESYLARYYEIIKENNANIASSLIQGEKSDSYFVAQRKVEDFGITFYDPLSSENVLKNEIRDLMSKKSIGNMAEFVVEKIALLCGLESESDFYKYLNDFDREYESIVNAQKELEPYLNGIEGLPFSGVNGFEPNSFLSNFSALKGGVASCFSNGVLAADEKGIAAVKTAMSAVLLPVMIYGDYNRDALIIARGIRSGVEKAAGFLSKAEEAAEDSEPVNVNSLEEVEKRRKKLAYIGDFSEICGALEANILGFDGVITSNNRFEAEMTENQLIRFEDASGIIEKAEKAYKNYRKVTQKIGNTVETDFSLSILYDKAVEAAGVFLNFTPPDNSEIDKDIYETLPSKTAGIGDDTGSFAGVDVGDMGEAYSKSLGILSETVGNAEKNTILDGYFIDDYIMTYFGSTGGEKRPSAYSYLNGEIEYIIFGGQSDDNNMKAAYGSIYALRVNLNALHILRDSEKMETIESVSEHPVIVGLLVTVWSLFESAFDLYDLRKGEGVPLIKTDEDWHCDLNGAEREATDVFDFEEDKEENLTSLTYTGYLRILLALTGRQTKLKRIQDLLELNYWKVNRVYKRLSEFACGVCLKSDVAVDTLLFRNMLNEGKGRFRVESNGTY